MASLPNTCLYLSTFYPKCHQPLRRIKSKRNDEFFLGCTGYPQCKYTDSYDEALNDCLAWFAATIDTDLKQLIVLSHPDKWSDNILAHEVTLRLNALRSKVAAMFEGERR